MDECHCRVCHTNTFHFYSTLQTLKVAHFLAFCLCSEITFTWTYKALSFINYFLLTKKTLTLSWGAIYGQFFKTSTERSDSWFIYNSWRLTSKWLLMIFILHKIKRNFYIWVEISIFELTILTMDNLHLLRSPCINKLIFQLDILGLMFIWTLVLTKDQEQFELKRLS